jgi:hypothetical protein
MSDRDEFERWYDEATNYNDGVAYYVGINDRYCFSDIEIAWQAWQAARTQSGQGVEPVAVVELSDYIHLSGASASQRKALKEVSEGSIQNLPVGTRIYTQPQPAVPEEYRQALQDAYDIIVCDANSPKNYGSLCRIGHVLGQITTPTTPQADGWVRCEDRLPTYRDSDEYGDVWVMSKLYGVKKMSWSSVRADFESHWMPTGLKRPQPPKEASDMSGYRNEWPCCGDETYTQGREPVRCPFCEMWELKEKLEQADARATRLSEALQVAVDTPELGGGTWYDMAVAVLAERAGGEQ